MQHLKQHHFTRAFLLSLLSLTFLIFALWARQARADANTCSPAEMGFIQKSLRTICKKEGEPDKTIFILVDGSDPFNKKSISWIKANVFNKRVIKPSAEGDEILIGHFHKGALSSMKVYRLCSPKPNDQISYIFDAPQKVKKQNRSFYCVVEQLIPNKIFSRPTSAKKSLILEAISEVLDNPKLLFADRKGKRVFILVSDLFQNSSNFSFHKICTRKSRRSPVLCPSYKEVLKATARNKRYLEGLPVKFRSTDEVIIFNVNIEGKLDRSAENFWRGFFESAGVPSDNILFKFELEQ